MQLALHWRIHFLQKIKMKNNKFKVYLILLSAIVLVGKAQATWCLPTHLVFNDELTKMDKSGEPFRIGTLDKEGYSLGVIKETEKSNYRYLRNIQIEGVEFREFRNGSFKFYLAMPNENKIMLYRYILADEKGIQRGFAGYCS